MKKLLMIAAAIAFMPSVALADGGECDGGAGVNPRCFNATAGNPFFAQPNQTDVTGSIDGQPAALDHAPAARRQTHSDPRLPSPQ
jgi:hypothetical protein